MHTSLRALGALLLCSLGWAPAEPVAAGLVPAPGPYSGSHEGRSYGESPLSAAGGAETPVRIDIGSTSAVPGGAVAVTVFLEAMGAAVAGTGNDIRFPSTVLGLDPADCILNPALSKQVTASFVAMTDTTATVRVFVQGTTNLPIPDGPLYTCTFHVFPDTPLGTLVLENPIAIAQDPDGVNLMPVTGGDGEIEIVPCLIDVDGSGPPPDVATDVVYILRDLLGLSAVPPSFRQIDPSIPGDTEIAAAVEDIDGDLDVDANGAVDPATDVLYVARFLIGLAPVPPSFRAVDPSIPPDPEIAARARALCP